MSEHTATILSGTTIAQQVLGEVKASVTEITAAGKRPPCIAFVRVGEDPASVSYVRKKEKTAAEVGIAAQLTVMDAEQTTQEALVAHINALNTNEAVDGILIQAPLPSHMCAQTVFNTVAPGKDVDGFSATNLGRLVQEDAAGFVACTPAGIVQIIQRSGIATRGKHVVVVGRSLIVGKPAALLMLSRELSATVTVCHSATENLEAVCAQADILIAAMGRPHALGAAHIKPGAAVIDVGINRIACSQKKSGYRLVGDVDFEAAANIASSITPVPGGVGPMTVAMLMANTLKAYTASV